MESSTRQRSSTSTLIPRVKSAARGRWLEIVCGLSSIRVNSDTFDGNKQPCPRCGGTDRFRAFDDFAEKGGVICGQCHREGNADGFATLSWLNGKSFPETVKAVSAFLGVQDDVAARPYRPKSSPSPSPASSTPIPSARKEALSPAVAQPAPIAPLTNTLQFLPWNAAVAGLWCMRRAPIVPAALELIGARMAKYYGLTVIAIPIWGPKLTAVDPVNWLVYNAAPGGMLPTKTGPVGKKIIGGNARGIIGNVQQLASRDVRKIKTEGPTDLLGLLSKDPKTTDCVFSNAFGANENPEHLPWLLPMVADSVCVTVHDQDTAGAEGLQHWAGFFAQTAAESRAVSLPFEMKESHGTDLRDYFVGGATLEDWELLIDISPIVEAVQVEAVIDEWEDDPHRLAKMNINFYEKTLGRKIRYWRGHWLTWKQDRYHFVSDEEMQAKLNMRIKSEFDRVWKEESKAYRDNPDPDDKKGPPKARRVSLPVVRDTSMALRAQCLLSNDIELGTWIDSRQRRKYLACANGILDIQALIEGKNEAFFPHSPNWFSTSCLDYDFNSDAKCDLFHEYVNQATCGDQAKADLLQEFVGYVLSPDNNMQKFLALEGTGGNGKSVFLAAIEAIIGRANISSVALESFGEKFQLFETLGKMLNICNEANEVEGVAESVLKKFTGGDLILFEQKRKNPITTKATAKIIINWNLRPRFKDRSDGLWRRMMIVTFNNKVANPNPEMVEPEFWKRHDQLSGMLNWAIAGLLRLHERQRFTEWDGMRDLIESIRDENSTPRLFIKDAYNVRRNAPPVLCSGVYKEYADWCYTSGYKQCGEATFGKELRQALPGVDRERETTGERRWYYTNLEKVGELTENQEDEWQRSNSFR
jgi:P4 family phage/plasmid primase-like protien